MGEFVSGKSSAMFKETAFEYSHPTLADKKNQETRWVRAQLSAKHSYFRNMPTLYILFGQQEAAAASKNDLTRQKEMQKKR